MQTTSVVTKRTLTHDHTRDKDAAFLQAEAKLKHLLVALDRVAEFGARAGSDDRLIDEACATFDWIRRTKPRTLVGAAVKLRTMLHPELGIEFTFNPDDDPASLQQVLGIIDREIERRT